MKIYSIFLVFLLASCSTKDKSDSVVQKDSVDSKPMQVIQEDVKLNEVASTPRFQILQSSIAARGTYRLDSYTGDVWQMVAKADESTLWEKIPKRTHNIVDEKKNGQSNYSLFLSTLSMKFTYLINVNTGATWQLFQDSSENLFLAPIAE